MLDIFLEILRKCHFCENFQIRITEEIQAGFSLGLPQLAIGIDYAISLQN
jgi:hypothetical protein